MINSVQLVRDLCKKRNIPVARLEKDCGFSNGYLNPKKMQKLPYDRAVVIAKYLGVSIEHILEGNKNSVSAKTDERAINDHIDDTLHEKKHREYNSIRIAARDGSFQERHLTDQQLAALQAILDQMPDVPEGL